MISRVSAPTLCLKWWVPCLALCWLLCSSIYWWVLFKRRLREEAVSSLPWCKHSIRQVPQELELSPYVSTYTVGGNQESMRFFSGWNCVSQLRGCPNFQIASFNQFCVSKDISRDIYWHLCFPDQEQMKVPDFLSLGVAWIGRDQSLPFGNPVISICPDINKTIWLSSLICFANIAVRHLP